MGKKKGLLWGTTAAFAIVCTGIILWFTASKNDFPERTIDYTACGFLDYDEGNTCYYSELTNGILAHKNEITVERKSEQMAGRLNEVKDDFRKYSVLSGFEKDIQITEDGFKISYTYGKSRQKKMIQEMNRSYAELLRVPQELEATENGKVIGIYHNIAEKCTAGASTLPQDEEKLSYLTAFLYAQAEIQAEPVISTDEKSSLVMENNKDKTAGTASQMIAVAPSEEEEKAAAIGQEVVYGNYVTAGEHSYYIFPGEEVRNTAGQGLTYCGLSTASADYFAYHDEFESLIDGHNIEENKDTSLLFLHNTVSFRCDGENKLYLYLSDESELSFDIAEGKREVILDRGFECIKTEDGYRSYLYTPKEAKGENGSKRPLIICLHGASQASGSLSVFGTPLKQPKFQKPIGGANILVMWSKLEYYRKPYRYNEMVQEIIKTHEGIDPAKVMIYGFSNGAVFACKMMIDQPELYQGMLISGCLYEWTDEQLERVKDKHIWMMNGALDEGCIVRSERETSERMKALGMDITFHEFPCVEHSPCNLVVTIPGVGCTGAEWIADRVGK